MTHLSNLNVRFMYSASQNIRRALNDNMEMHTAISRKVVGKNVHATIPKGNTGYNQYTVPDIVAVEPSFVVFF